MSVQAKASDSTNYPRKVTLKDNDYTLRIMSVEDGEALRAFAIDLPAHDTLYMRRDLRSERGIESWIEDIEDGTIRSLLAVDDAGCSPSMTLALRVFPPFISIRWNGPGTWPIFALQLQYARGEPASAGCSPAKVSTWHSSWVLRNSSRE